MTEAFHDDNSATPDPCGCAWQQHVQSHGSEYTFCRGVKFLYDDGNPIKDSNGFWKKEPCICTAVAPRHFQRRIIGAEVVCNCGWTPESAEPDETWDNHEDRGVYV